MPPSHMCGGGHLALSGTPTKTWRPQRHASGHRLQRKKMVHSAQRRDHLSTPRRNNNHRNPSEIHTRRRQRALNAGRRRHVPPHGARRHRPDPTCGKMAQQCDAELTPHDRKNFQSGACGAHGPTRGLCAHPTRPRRLKHPLPDSGPLLGLLWVTVGGLE